MKKLVTLALTLCCSVALWGQQDHINFYNNPQANKENIKPFGTSVISPEVHPDRTVTFRLLAPNAKEVSVSGTGPIKLTPMTKDDKGVWSVTVGPYEPNQYRYNFTVDGLKIIDPANTFVHPSAQPAFCLLYVPDDNGPTYYDPKTNVPHGSVTEHYYYSEVTKGVRELYVYTPPCYDRNKRYPVLYLMHGSGDDSETWYREGRMNYIVDNMIAEGTLIPTIVVFTNNNVVNRGDPRHTELAFPLVEQEMKQCILPLVDQNYSTINNRHARAIGGLSMGGRMAQYVGLRNLDLFGSFGLFSSAIEFEETPDILKDNFNDRVDYLFLGAGPDETNDRARHQVMHNKFDDKGIKHEYVIAPTGAHNMISWKWLMYYHFLPHLWKNNYNF